MKKKLIITLFIAFLTLPNISFGADDDLKELTDAINDAQKEFNDLKTVIPVKQKLLTMLLRRLIKPQNLQKRH